MAYIAFIAILFGAAGIAGGIETENLAGTITAAVIHTGGIVAMAVAGRKEGQEAEGGSEADKPPGRDGTC